MLSAERSEENNLVESAERSEENNLTERGWKVAQARWRRRKNKKKGCAKTLVTIEPEGLCVIGEGEWECVEMAVDSGATETVIGEHMVTAVKTTEEPASRRGVAYEIANGDTIPNHGEKHFVVESEEGTRKTITAQVADVNKGLLSVRKIVAAGIEVVFDTHSYIEDKCIGERMWLTDAQGMYMLMWVKNSPF